MKKLLFTLLIALVCSVASAQTFRGTFIGNGLSVTNVDAAKLQGRDNLAFLSTNTSYFNYYGFFIQFPPMPHLEPSVTSFGGFRWPKTNSNLYFSLERDHAGLGGFIAGYDNELGTDILRIGQYDGQLGKFHLGFNTYNTNAGVGINYANAQSKFPTGFVPAYALSVSASTNAIYARNGSHAYSDCFTLDNTGVGLWQTWTRGDGSVAWRAGYDTNWGDSVLQYALTFYSASTSANNYEQPGVPVLRLSHATKNVEVINALTVGANQTNARSLYVASNLVANAGNSTASQVRIGGYDGSEGTIPVIYMGNNTGSAYISRQGAGTSYFNAGTEAYFTIANNLIGSFTANSFTVIKPFTVSRNGGTTTIDSNLVNTTTLVMNSNTAPVIPTIRQMTLWNSNGFNLWILKNQSGTVTTNLLN